MPIDVTLQYETGEVIARAGGDGVLDLVCGLRWNDAASHFLRFIDPWGHTMFNERQAAPFRVELLHYSAALTRASDQASIRAIADLATQCVDEHLYLHFFGD